MSTNWTSTYDESVLITFEVVVGFTLVRWFVKCMSEYLLVVPIRWLIGSVVSVGSTMSSHFVNTLVSDGMVSTVNTSEGRFAHLLAAIIGLLYSISMLCD